MKIFSESSVVGLDIGTSSVKAVQIIKREDGFYLAKAALKELKDPADEKEILVAINDSLRGVNIKRSKFIVVANCPRTCARTVETPYMPKAELAAGIRLTAKNFFPFPIDDSSLDFGVLDEVVDKGVKRYRLLVATSTKETVEKYLSLLNRLSIKPSSFIPVPLALQKIIEERQLQKDQTSSIIDIGSRFTELAIFRGKELAFCRKIPVAGGDFSKAMTGLLVSERGKTELSLRDAEKIKREIGIPAEGDSRIVDGKISTSQILSMLRPAAEQLAGEIGRCFDYYKDQTGAEKIDNLVLFGGGANLKGLAEFLSLELGMEIKIGNPLENVKLMPDLAIEKEGLADRLAPAIGAALSLGKGINLLPVEMKEEKRRTIKRAGILAASTAIILTSVLLYIGMRLQLANLQKRTDVAMLEYSSLQPQLKLAQTQNMANAALADEPYWEDVFKELSNTIPPNIRLTELNTENKLITMKGMIFSEEPEELLSDFILVLEKGIFNKVKLVNIKDITDKPGSIFELNCWVD